MRSSNAASHLCLFRAFVARKMFNLKIIFYYLQFPISEVCVCVASHQVQGYSAYMNYMVDRCKSQSRVRDAPHFDSNKTILFIQFGLLAIHIAELFKLQRRVHFKM